MNLRDAPFRVGQWRVNPALDEICRDGTTVKLEPRTMRVLMCLAEHGGEVVSVDQLLDTVWQGLVVTQFSVYRAVALLRGALEDDARNPTYIASVPRRGYRLVAPIETEAKRQDPQPLPHELQAEAKLPEEPAQRLLSGEVSKTIRIGSPVTEHGPASSRSKRVLPVAVAGVIAVALLVVLVFFGLERLRGLRPSVQGKSIAVLPLANESGDASQQYFSDGISEDLITALSQFPGLKVIGRTSSFHFRDSKEDSRSIGAKLGVAHVLAGSVRRSGDVVRVSAQLINTEDGSAQWSERYDRPYKDLFALQDEITRAVAGALRAKLLPSEAAAVQTDRPPSGNLEAYNAFLQGRFFERRGTEADYRRAIGFYTQATELDPRYARAWSGLSGAWSGLSATFLEGTSAQEAYAKSRAAADRALILFPELAAAHIARGQLLYLADFDWRGSEAEYRRALELAPSDGRAKVALGVQLATFGQVEQAIELTREAQASEPLRDDWYSNLAVYLSGLNRLDEAERAIRRAIDLQPVAPLYHGTLAIIEIQRGNADAALAVAQQESPGVWQDIALALARQIGVNRSAADSAVRTLIAKDASTSAYQVAQVYALRGDAKETFAWLERAWTSRDPGIANLLYDPFILRYKDDPRFAAFCRKVGLPTPAEVETRTWSAGLR